MRPHRIMVCSVIAASTLAAATEPAWARPEAPSAADMEARRATARKLTQPISIELNDTRLEDIIQFIRDFSGVEIEAYWRDERGESGLNRDQSITISVKDATVITLIERVLAKAETDFSPATWQFAPGGGGGTIEVGPRSRLNKQAYLVMYDIQDLLFQVPDFPDAPQLDLDQVLNQGAQGGGAGGGSVFGESGEQTPIGPTEEELGRRLVDLITEYIEPEQWDINGGDGGTIREYSRHLIIRAPDYIHRQLAGYPFDLGRPGRAGTAKSAAKR